MKCCNPGPFDNGMWVNQVFHALDCQDIHLLLHAEVTIKPRKGLQIDPNDALALSGCCGKPVPVYFNGIWSCETCGNVDKNRSAISDGYKPSSAYGIPSFKPKCECGASKTINSNCHSPWCPAFVR